MNTRNVRAKSVLIVVSAVCVMSMMALCRTAVASSQSDSFKEMFLKGDYRGCGQEAARVIASGRRLDSDESYYIAGLSFLKSGDFSAAEKMFSVLLNELHTSRFTDEARIGIGDSLWLKGDVSGARRRYEDFVRTRYSSKLKAGVYYRLYLAAKKNGRSSVAQEYRNKLRVEFPQSPEAVMEQDIFPVGVSTPVAVAAPLAVPAVVPSATVQQHTPTEQKPMVISAADILVPQRGAYSIQVGAFSKKINADRLSRKLATDGYPSFIEQAVSKSGAPVYKVRVGRFDDLSTARKQERKLSLEGYSTKLDSQ
jgi:cell division septation protein DedD